MKYEVEQGGVIITNAKSKVTGHRWDFCVTKDYSKHYGFFYQVKARCYDCGVKLFKNWLYTEYRHATSEKSVVKAVTSCVRTYEKEKELVNCLNFNVSETEHELKDWNGEI